MNSSMLCLPRICTHTLWYIKRLRETKRSLSENYKKRKRSLSDFHLFEEINACFWIFIVLSCDLPSSPLIFFPLSCLIISFLAVGHSKTDGVPDQIEHALGLAVVVVGAVWDRGCRLETQGACWRTDRRLRTWDGDQETSDIGVEVVAVSAPLSVNSRLIFYPKRAPNAFNRSSFDSCI